MPVLEHRYLSPDGELGLWQITEDEQFFLDKLLLYNHEKEQLNNIKGRRRIEWLAVRLLLHQMSGRDMRAPCLKDANGKPYLEGSFFDISISHSQNMAAVIAAPRLVGIDIQYIVQKIERIQHKFLNSSELESIATNKIEHLHVYWGAKECLYKAHGRRKLDFKKHIHIQPFAYSPEGAGCSGQVTTDTKSMHFKIHYEKIGEYIMVYATEEVEDYIT